MRKLLSQLFLPLLLSFALVPSSQTLARPATVMLVIDDEYDGYKKKGDSLYRDGKYLEARRQYQNCLEVPGFENDAYAKKKVEDCTTGMALRQKVNESMQKGQNAETLALLNQLKNLNPDPTTLDQLATYYEREGNKFFTQKRYQDAKNSYAAALEFANPAKKETLQIQIQNIDNLTRPVYPKRIGLKAAVGVVAVGAGAFGILLRQDYSSKLSTLNQISQSADPNNTGIIDDRALYDQYDVAYQNAEAAKKKVGISTACFGVAAVAVLAEAYLLVHKPKPRPVGFTIHSASQSWGLAVRYTF